MIRLSWDTADTSRELQTALATLAEEYPLVADKKGEVRLTFRPISSDRRTVTVTKKGSEAIIEYTDTAAALRGVGLVLARAGERNFSATEATSFATFGIMLDCSRNAVMKVDHFCGWLRKLSLLGYTMAMLYTEDTYQLPGEPYFGYQRGAYSAEELKAIDDYAHRLGIEMIPCIQTLGHLEQILKWTAYNDVKDTSSVLLVDEDKTYALIEKMIATSADCFRSRRIHIGMDETHDLGRGRFMDLFGHERGFDIFNRHLAKVTAMCRKHNLSPMIWSDMYFRMGSKTMDYYDKACVIPADVKAKIPKDVELVYWDYYHHDEEFYLDWIQRHRDLGKEPLMGSGVWTWCTLWNWQWKTAAATGPCVRASLKAGLKEFFVTLWGDDGAFCDFDSAMAGMVWVAELAYTGKTPAASLGKRFEAICHGDYKESVCATDWGRELMWDDPIMGIFWHNQNLVQRGFGKKIRDCYAKELGRLKKCRTKTTSGGDFGYAVAIADFLLRKIDLRLKLDTAYARRNKAGLKAVRKDIPKTIRSLEVLDEAFRTQWLRRNKPFGLEVMQIRFAGQKRRYEELDRRIGELLAGKIDRIDEMENLPSVALDGVHGNYRALAAGTSIL